MTRARAAHPLNAQKDTNVLNTIRSALDRVLAGIVVFLVLALSGVVVLGFMSRLLDAPLSWTGEVAGIGLAWLTFYGSALAAGRGAHIASPSILAVMPRRLRLLTAVLSEALIILFFILLFWTGMEVIEVLQGSNLVSLPNVSQQLSESALPIGAALFVIAELLRLPELFKEVSEGRVAEIDDGSEEEVDLAETSAETE